MPFQIPALVECHISPRAKDIIAKTEKFVNEECVPADWVIQDGLGYGPERWSKHPPIIDELKAKAKALGLWNIFLSKTHYKEGAGLSNVEYALVAELLGRAMCASEAMNCSAPDTGNMEVLAKYGTPEQKKQWLEPLLDGQIRSAFLMTEPDIASSDARNVKLTMVKDGNDWILNGRKWWSSGAGDPRCKVYFVMGKSHPDAPHPYLQQSVILVPSGTPGIKIERMLTVFGYDDAPHGHAELVFNNVRVPESNMILGPGRGFETVQGRLGPGRLHHCMRAIGIAERALEEFIARVNDPRRETFGLRLNRHGVILDWIARSRIEIDAARLMVLNAAIKVDNTDAKDAQREIGMAKIHVPKVVLKVIDRAIQSFGAAGLGPDTPLPAMYAIARSLRIADGPDEVHLMQLGRNESKTGKEMIEKIQEQRNRTAALFKSRDAKAKL